MRIDKNNAYYQGLEKLVGDNGEELMEVIKLREKWFKHNFNDTRLNTHPLKGKMTGKWAFSIDDDVRVVFVKTGKNSVRFISIGTHEEVYGEKLGR